MDRAYEAGAVALAPTAPVTPSIGYPTGGNPLGGVPATKPGDWWFHMITEELRALIVAAGLTPSHATVNQVAAAVAAIAKRSELGVDQTYQDMSASRSANTTYTNSTQKPIFVLASWAANTSNYSVTSVVNGVNVALTNVQNVLTIVTPLIVPPGGTYRVNTTAGLVTWFEVR